MVEEDKNEVNLSERLKDREKRKKNNLDDPLSKTIHKTLMSFSIKKGVW